METRSIWNLSLEKRSIFYFWEAELWEQRNSSCLCMCECMCVCQMKSYGCIEMDSVVYRRYVCVNKLRVIYFEQYMKNIVISIFWFVPLCLNSNQKCLTLKMFLIISFFQWHIVTHPHSWRAAVIENDLNYVN